MPGPQRDDENGDGCDDHQQQDFWDRAEKALPLLAFAMEGESPTAKILALLMVVLVIRGSSNAGKRED